MWIRRSKEALKHMIEASLPSLYNPGTQSDAALKLNFIARTDVLAELTAALTRESATSVATHRLLIGQSGTGKTMMLHRLGLAVRETPELDALWLPVTFPEEQYTIARLADFWHNCLVALADAIEQRQMSAAEHLEAHLITPSGNAAEALQSFMAAVARTGKRPLLLIDNFDFILDRLSESEAWSLRAELQRPGGPIVIGSARVPLNQGSKDPFYEFMHLRFLDAMSLDESGALISEFGRRHQRPDIVEAIRVNPARITPLHLLTSGNLRAVVQMYLILANCLNQDTQRDIEALADSATPMFKARFDAMSNQHQRLFIDIASAHAPQTARDVEKRLQLGINVVSAQINKMVASGVLSKTTVTGKRLHFQVADDFFKFWYLMRAPRRYRQGVLQQATDIKNW